MKAGAAYGIHCDHLDDRSSHSAVFNVSLGNQGIRDLRMYVPQLKMVPPLNERNCILFPAKTYRHTNLGGGDTQNRLCVTMFTIARPLFTLPPKQTPIAMHRVRPLALPENYH